MEYTAYTDLMLLLLILLLPLVASIKVKMNYNKYLLVKSSQGLSGCEVARKILDKNNLTDIHVVETRGNLTDHYDPSRKVVRLSHDVFHGTSVSSISIAAHECGHAIQDKDGYFFMRVRSFIFPIVNIATTFSYILIFIGILASLTDLIMLGIALTGCGLLFQIITLPVEFDASKRAKVEINTMHLTSDDEQDGVSKVLSAAAMTYVAGVLASILQLLRLFLMFNDRD